jgi:hypothetical protein
MTASANETECFAAETIAYNMFVGSNVDTLLAYSRQEEELKAMDVGYTLPVLLQSIQFTSSSNMLASSFNSNEVRASGACECAKRKRALTAAADGTCAWRALRCM